MTERHDLAHAFALRARAARRAAAWRVAAILCGACVAAAAPSYTCAGAPVVHTVTVQEPTSPQERGDARRFMH
ncbi:hypothetical protein SB778_34970, partial [Paraburkholderia sp. SIMBA_050]